MIIVVSMCLTSGAGQTVARAGGSWSSLQGARGAGEISTQREPCGAVVTYRTRFRLHHTLAWGRRGEHYVRNVMYYIYFKCG